jgi:aspartate/methionine/tyrosine aminotransferase
VRGAQFAGARVEELPLLEQNDFLPDLDAVPASTWRRTALFWVNYPNNPTGAMAAIAFYERLAALAREHDFVLASDEAYGALVRRATARAAAARLAGPSRSTQPRSARR